MNIKSRINKLENHLKSIGIDAKKGILLESIQEGDFLWVIDPDRDWEVFFKENKGKKISEVWDLVLDETAQKVWADDAYIY